MTVHGWSERAQLGGEPDIIPGLSDRAQLVLLHLASLIGLCLVVVALLAEVAEDRRDADYQACRRGNLATARALLTSAAAHPAAGDIARRASVLVDCEYAADHDGLTRPLPKPTQREYLALVAQGEWPLVRGGRVVGAQRLPDGLKRSDLPPLPGSGR